jgi:phosphate starvation-inducible PhoH-like protein
MSVSSSKRNRGNTREDRRANKDRFAQQGKSRFVEPQEQPVHYSTSFRDIQTKNYAQATYLEAMKQNDIVFGVGSAGTGKTYVAAWYAAGELFHRRIEKIILTRPNVEAGPSMGFLPGELDEKYEPYLRPFKDVFEKALGKGFFEYALKTKQIEPIPIGFMRGQTFDDCIVLVDESQNIEPDLMKMITSRIGNNTKMIFSGDTSQKDILGTSGLADAVKVLEGIRGIEVVRFMSQDIVRSKMCKSIIMAYENIST